MTTPRDLLGTWVLERDVDDHLNGEQRRVEGSTTLTEVDAATVRWDEVGTMRWAWHEVPVSRTLYAVERDGGWWVTFEDGRDFHPWSPGDDVVHPCAPDTYRGRVEVLAEDRWSVTWRATGPQKDYTMHSTLTRRSG
ncbi:MAG: DUF6314 family protein [Aeromicrobium erythreum]